MDTPLFAALVHAGKAVRDEHDHADRTVEAVLRSDLLGPAFTAAYEAAYARRDEVEARMFALDDHATSLFGAAYAAALA